VNLAQVAPRRDPTALLLALMMLVVPAMGATHSDLQQGSLKAIAVVFFTLAAVALYLWNQRQRPTPVRLHALLWLPLGLLLWALGSMAWSHTYLATVEATRWLVFALLLFLGLNTLTLGRTTPLAWGIHAGASLAALWTALQFWFDWPFFPQGPNPASTFANRNFFAEFLICTLPFSVLLLGRLRSRWAVFGLTFSIGFNVVALMMTGTRSALISLMILGPLLPFITARYRSQWQAVGWQRQHGVGLGLLLLATVGLLGSIPTTNAKLAAESGYGSAIDRTLRRSLSVTQADEYSEGSSAQRLIMWKGTLRMLAAHPLAGVGAGAWEVQIPLYQEAGSEAEYSDFPHNEPLQLLAEYGLVGAVLLLGLLAYLWRTAISTWRMPSPPGLQEAPLRAFTLASLLVLLLVSNAGFPWHMATTSALFALSLGLLAASDTRLATTLSTPGLRQLAWPRALFWPSMGALTLATAVAAFVSAKAVASESRLLQASHLAERILASGQPEAPQWDTDKARVMQLLREGMAINPHQRQLSGEVADALASWGDMRNATQVWETLLASRPNIVIMLAFVARAHALEGDLTQAQLFFDRARALQPQAPVVQTLEVLMLRHSGQSVQAAARAQTLLQNGVHDPDLIAQAYELGLALHQPTLAILALERGIAALPERASDGWRLLGDVYASDAVKNEAKALQAYRSALALMPAHGRDELLGQLPPSYRSKL